MDHTVTHFRIRNKTVPKDVRREALRAIHAGQGLEAVARANAIADEINKVSIYDAPPIVKITRRSLLLI